MELPRIGTGFDVHPLSADQPCWIAGLLWEGFPGCAGHSDGDVVAHAMCDALLAAAGMGDLGVQFGVSDPEWADASGVRLLAQTAQRLTAAGWKIGNVSVQLISDTPRLAERRTEAQALLSETIGAPVGLSATTTDGLGFIGRGDGRAAVASALVAGISA